MAAASFGSLRRRDDFRRLQGAKRLARGPLSLRFREGGDELLVGFGVPRSFGTAPERNRMRRRLRAAIAEVTRRQPAFVGYVLISARRPALTLGFGELVESLEHMFASMPRQPE